MLKFGMGDFHEALIQCKSPISNFNKICETVMEYLEKFTYSIMGTMSYYRLIPFQVFGHYCCTDDVRTEDLRFRTCFKPELA
jgi:hypothetical protein